MADDYVDPFAAEFEQLRKRNAEYDEAQRIAARPTGEVVQRDVRSFGTGLNDAIGSAVGAIPDAVGAGVRAVERAVSPSTINTVAAGPRQYTFAPQPGQFTKWAQGGLNAFGDAVFGGHLNPDTPTERNLYAAGEGVGNAAAVVAPAAAVARTAQAGGAVANIAERLAANPVTQGVSGAVAGSVGQGTGSPTLGTIAGMATPLATSVARGVVSPGLSQLNPEQAELARRAAANNIQLTPGQMSGSTPLRTMESVMREMPLTSGPARAAEEAQRVQYNRAALAHAGEYDATHATPEVVNAALERSGQAMSDIYSRNNFRVDAPAMQSVQAVADQANRYLPESVRQPVLNRIEDFTSKVQSDGQGGFRVEGPAFASLDSELSKHIRTTSDGQVRDTLLQLRQALRAGMAGSITGEDAEALDTARRQYANGKVIQAAMNTPSAVTAGGNIPAGRLSTVLASGSGNNYAAGRGDLNDLGRIGRAFIQDPVPQSGTPMRTAMKTLLTGGMMGGGAYFGGGDPLHSIALGAGAVGLPPIIQSLATSPVGRAYLTNQAAGAIGPQTTRGTMAGVATSTALPGLLGEPAPPTPGPGPRRSLAPYLDPRFQPQ